MEEQRTQVTSITLSDLQDSAYFKSTPKSMKRIESSETLDSLHSPPRQMRVCRGVAKVGDFRSSFLKPTMWPELSPADQFAYQRELKSLNAAYSAQIRENANLKREAALPVERCGGCAKERTQREATEVALTQAVQLTNLLLQEVRRLDSEILRVASPRSKP